MRPRSDIVPRSYVYKNPLNPNRPKIRRPFRVEIWEDRRWVYVTSFSTLPKAQARGDLLIAQGKVTPENVKITRAGPPF